MLLGALTAAGAFFVLMLTDFQGIREFGFVSGIAILLAFVVDDHPVSRAARAASTRRWTRVGDIRPSRSIARAELRWLERVIRLPQDHPGDHRGA